MKFVPSAPQVPMIDHVLNNRFCALWASMGIGKTSAMLYSLSILKLINDGPALIVAPKFVASVTWPEEVKKWDGFGGLTVSVVVGTEKQRKAALEVNADLYTINFENLQWLRLNWPKRLNLAKCVIDESTKVKGYRRNKGSSRARALLHMLKDIKYLIELTGTPGSNGLIDLWGQIYFLDLGKRLGTSFTSFKGRWFEEIDCGGYFTKTVPKESAIVEIPNVLKDICLSVNAEDYFSIDKVIETNISVNLPNSAMAMYKKFYKEMLAQLADGEEIRAFNGAAKTLKCIQIASGAIYTDEESEEWSIVHDEKLDALECIIEEAAGEPLLIAYHFKHDASRIKKRFASSKIFDGKASTLTAWNNGEIQQLIAHPASLGHGLNLQDGGRRIVFYTHWWSLEERSQIIERIGPMRQMQSGHKRSVFQYNIVARGTIDEQVIEAHKHKRSVDTALRLATRGV